MSMKGAYKQKIEAQLNEWKAEIDKIEGKSQRRGCEIGHFKIQVNL